MPCPWRTERHGPPDLGTHGGTGCRLGGWGQAGPREPHPAGARPPARSELTLSHIGVWASGEWECSVSTIQGNASKKVEIVVLETSASYCPAERVANNRGDFRFAQLCSRGGNPRPECPCPTPTVIPECAREQRLHCPLVTEPSLWIWLLLGREVSLTRRVCKGLPDTVFLLAHAQDTITFQYLNSPPWKQGRYGRPNCAA